MNAIAPSSATSTATPERASPSAPPDAADPGHPVHAYSRLMDRVNAESMRDAARKGREAVEHHPFRTAALSALAGLAVGLLIARR